MAFSNKSRLEEQEVEQGKERVLQQFATDTVAEKPQDSLANALSLVLDQEPIEKQNQLGTGKPWVAKWRSQYEELPINPTNPDLRSVHSTLENEWQMFKQSLDSKNDEKEARKKKSVTRRLFMRKDTQTRPTWRIDSKVGQPLEIQDIITSVQDAGTYWKSKPRIAHGKAQQSFHKFCQSLHAHSNMLKCLPEQHQYLSVFCGVTITLIKASVNHQTVAEGLSESLSEISGPIRNCEAVVMIMDTADMHEAISSLYSHVFHFLNSAMQWFQSRALRKILNSLTENFYDSFRSQILKIRDICDLICQKGTIKSQAELRDLRLLVEDQVVKAALVQEEIREEQRKQGISRLQVEALGRQLVSSLRGNTEAWLHQDEGDVPGYRSSGFTTRRLTEQGGDNASQTTADGQKSMAISTVTRSELQQWSADLEDFTSNIFELLNIIDFSTCLAELEIIEAIREWSQSPVSQALWVRGRFQETYPSDATAIAAKVIATARDMAIPFLCFFFSIDDTMEDFHRTAISPYEAQGKAMAIDFIYTLIRQLINQLPQTIRLSSKRLSTRFENLDGSLRSFDLALKVFKELLDHAPATLLIIIDGIEQMEETAAELHVSEVLMLLQSVTTEKRNGKVVKILYSTAGLLALWRNWMKTT